LKKTIFHIIAIGMLLLAGCANQNPNDERAKDFTEKQLTQINELLNDFAKSKSCEGFTLLGRWDGSYPSDTTRRLQFWNIAVCGIEKRMIVMTRKVPQDGLEVCVSDSKPCAIVDSGLFKSGS